MKMYCPKCKSEHIIELKPTIIHNRIQSGTAIQTWNPHEQDLIQNIPAFNFQCQDCQTMFSVDSK